MGDKQHKQPLVEETKVKVLFETQASLGPDDKADHPLTGTNSIYSAILSRNETVKDAKRLKTFLELRDKYVQKKVLFEDPLFPANDSSLFYSHKSSMKLEWKRPSVSASLLLSLPLSQVVVNIKVALICLQKLSFKTTVYLITSSFTDGWVVKLIWVPAWWCIALGSHLLHSPTADSHTGGRSLSVSGNIVATQCWLHSFIFFGYSYTTSTKILCSSNSLGQCQMVLTFILDGSC